MQTIAETCVRFDAAHLSINLVSEIAVPMFPTLILITVANHNSIGMGTSIFLNSSKNYSSADIWPILHNSQQNVSLYHQ